MTSTTGPSHDRRVDGFTLLELIVVLVLIATMLAIAAPSLRNFFGGRKTADAAAAVLALTHLARSQAVAEGCIYRLNIDTEENRCWLSRQRAGVFESLDDQPSRRIELPDTVSLEVELVNQADENIHVHFYPNGRTDEATITLTDQRKNVFVLASQSAAEPFRILTTAEKQDVE